MKVSHIFAAVVLATAPVRAVAQLTLARGIVADSVTKEPMAGVLLSLSGNGYGETVTSHADGTFRFAKVTPGTYKLAARRLGYAPREMSIPIEENGVRISISLVRVAPLDTVRARRGTGIAGEVGTLKTLRPLANAELLVVGQSSRARTDSAGRFFIPLREPGTYVVRARTPGYEPVALSVVVARDSAPRLMLLLDSASAERSNAYEIAWRDFSDRARMRGTKSAIISHSELALTGELGLLDALQRAPSISTKQLKFGQTVCVFVDGRPAAGSPIGLWDVEQVEAVEVYTFDVRSDMTGTLREASRGYECQPTRIPETVVTFRDRIRWLVIWTRR